MPIAEHVRRAMRRLELRVSHARALVLVQSDDVDHQRADIDPLEEMFRRVFEGLTPKFRLRGRQRSRRLEIEVIFDHRLSGARRAVTLRAECSLQLMDVSWYRFAALHGLTAGPWIGGSFWPRCMRADLLILAS